MFELCDLSFSRFRELEEMRRLRLDIEHIISEMVEMAKVFSRLLPPPLSTYPYDECNVHLYLPSLD
jgi:hypothetical protein